MTKGPPPRLLDDPNAPAALREDIAEASRSAIAYDAAAGLSALKAAIDASTPASSPDGASDTAGTDGGAEATGIKAKLAALPGSAKLAAGTTALLLGITLAMLTTGKPTERPSQAEATLRTVVQTTGAHGPPVLPPPAPAPTTPTAPAPVAPAPQAEPAGVVPAPKVARAGRRPAKAHRPASAPASAERPDPEARMQQEVRQLARIKHLLPSDPASALALAEAGHRRFVGGMLEPEREALAIVALAKLGRHTEARRRAQRFERRFPDSPMRARIETATTQPAEEASP